MTQRPGRLLNRGKRAVARVIERSIDRRLASSSQVAADLDPHELQRLEQYQFEADHPYWCSETEAAALLRVHPSELAQLAGDGRIPHVQHHGRRVYRRQQLIGLTNDSETRRFLA